MIIQDTLIHNVLHAPLMSHCVSSIVCVILLILFSFSMERTISDNTDCYGNTKLMPRSQCVIVTNIVEKCNCCILYKLSLIHADKYSFVW